MSLRPEPHDPPSKWSAENPWSEVKHTPGAFPSSPQAQSEHDIDLSGQPSLSSVVKRRRKDYIRKRHIKIKIGTWNVASISGTEKDLGGWFVEGLGIKGLKQDLSVLSLADETEPSSDEAIESVAEQESHVKRKKRTLPVGEEAAVPSRHEIGLYVLGLQEVIDISSVAEAMRPYYDPNPARKWKHAVRRSLPHGYVKVAEQQLLGLLILVFAAPEVAPAISSVHATHVGTGALGYVGNKGAVSVRIVLGGTTRLVFVNCHLAAGADQAALNRRIWDTGQVLSRTKFEPSILDGDVNSVDHEAIGDEDFAFWFGDLNYRLDDIPGEDVRRLLLLHTRNEYDITNKSKRKIDSELGYIDASLSDSSSIDDGDEGSSSVEGLAQDSSAEPALDPNNDPASLITTINSLLQHDQLRAQQRLKKAFHEGWREGQINFLPTYKYDVGSVGMFDSGEKRRSPSWCDRILYRTRKDKQDYEDSLIKAKEAQKRDAEMTARGLDRGVQEEEEILFDYDPDTDGADHDDEYDEAEDAHDAQSVVTEDGFEDTIALEDYVAHQRVLSSDHKPLTAVFDLTYEAVIPELKSKVQQEVARLFDKNENEIRPSVTVVVDTPPDNITSADRPVGASELNAVEFGEIRFDVPVTRNLNIANTGPIPATFAFIDRAVEQSQAQGPSPSWLKIQVHHESQPRPSENDDLGASTRFQLSPGDATTVDLTVHVVGGDLIHGLNAGSVKVDDILVLRILNGRDHFVSISGNWCPSSFYRSLDELVRFPTGVRSKATTISQDKSGSLGRISGTFHSAPKELFDLSEAIPRLVERAVADWTMVHQGVTPPWETEPAWPFRGQVWNGSEEDRLYHLAALREALDTATPIADHIDDALPAVARVELLSDTLLLFLQSLSDGVITADVWDEIENALAHEKPKQAYSPADIQQIVVEALSVNPIHSVSFTFITFMITRAISEIVASGDGNEQTPTSAASRRSRSSTQASETPSELSTLSSESTTSIRSSFLPSFRRHRAEAVPGTAASPATSQVSPRGREKFVMAYAEVFAPAIIRSRHDENVKGREKKMLPLRKRKVLEAILESSSM